MIRIKNLRVPYDAAQPLAMIAAERLSLPTRAVRGGVVLFNSSTGLLICLLRQVLKITFAVFLAFS